MVPGKNKDSKNREEWIEGGDEVSNEGESNKGEWWIGLINIGSQLDSLWVDMNYLWFNFRFFWVLWKVVKLWSVKKVNYNWIEKEWWQELEF